MGATHAQVVGLFHVVVVGVAGSLPGSARGRPWAAVVALDRGQVRVDWCTQRGYECGRGHMTREYVTRKETGALLCPPTPTPRPPGSECTAACMSMGRCMRRERCPLRRVHIPQPTGARSMERCPWARTRPTGAMGKKTLPTGASAATVRARVTQPAGASDAAHGRDRVTPPMWRERRVTIYIHPLPSGAVRCGCLARRLHGAKRLPSGRPT